MSTCTVAGAANQGARPAILRIARDNARARIVVTGCYATRVVSKTSRLAAAVVLTDNFLQMRIPPGLPRNVRVQVRGLTMGGRW